MAKNKYECYVLNQIRVVEVWLMITCWLYQHHIDVTIAADFLTNIMYNK